MPPALALSPLAAHSDIAVMAESTIWVPAGPSKRAHPPRTPGKRERRSTIARVCQVAIAVRPDGSAWPRDRPAQQTDPAQMGERGSGGTPERQWGRGERAVLSAVVPSAPDKLPIKMLNDRLLVKIPDKDGERRSQGGILIPATAQMAKRLVWAEVVALGQNVRAAEVGDLVLFSPEDRYEVEVQGSDFIMLRERDLHAVAAERIEASTGLYL